MKETVVMNGHRCSETAGGRHSGKAGMSLCAWNINRHMAGLEFKGEK